MLEVAFDGKDGLCGFGKGWSDAEYFDVGVFGVAFGRD